ncbi:ORF_PT3 [Ostreid herpesvirus 1]|nr:ORF_PT3 [Ostreid herpesvirus 1]
MVISSGKTLSSSSSSADLFLLLLEAVGFSSSSPSTFPVKMASICFLTQGQRFSSFLYESDKSISIGFSTFLRMVLYTFNMLCSRGINFHSGGGFSIFFFPLLLDHMGIPFPTHLFLPLSECFCLPRK